MTDRPGYTPETIVRGLSLRRRLGTVAVGLAGLGAAATLTLLWATEPGPLAARTAIAFAVLILIGLGWTGFAAWTLARRPLFALDRVVAGWLATGFTGLVTAGSVVLAATRSGAAAAVLAAAAGTAVTGAAVTILVRARAYRGEVIRRGAGRR
ncbi:hypothetical protein [Actinoplanes sp. NPDC051494]|uniref:hypothetical protein n=1 Tax=Actinoplanes sp. NPDC051494 TaxID=3363907 RepID=UPI00378CA01F